MKICKLCGVEIINGENGCTMAGDICFKCKPWKMDKIVPATLWISPDEVYERLNYAEGRCLDMGYSFA